MTDRQLLHQFLHGDHASFELLVRRHIDMVYAAARRQIGPAHADDITQAVFIMLAQKASALQRRESLAGWLYRAATFRCLNYRRTESIRRQHERQSAMVAPAPITPEPDDLVELLDGALTRLSESDREVILLHHLQQKSHVETAAALGISEEAARKRAARALEKLRALLVGQGAPVPLASITTLLAAQAATHSPPALLTTTLAAGAHAALAHAGSFSLGGWLLMSTAKTKFVAAVLIALLLAAITTTVVMLRSNAPTPATPFTAAPISTDSIDPITKSLPVAPDELAGRVLDPRGNPVPNAAVSIPRFSPFDRDLPSLRADRVPPTTTDANGIFRFPHLGDTWISYLQVEKPGFAILCFPDVVRGRPNEVRLDNTTLFTGTILTPNGTLAANASLIFTADLPSTRDEIGKKITYAPFLAAADAQGHFDIPLMPNNYDLRVSNADNSLFARLPITIRPNQTLNQSITLVPGAHLILHITDKLNGRPVPDAEFYVWRWWAGAVAAEPGTKRNSDSAGSVEWTNLMPGFQYIDVAAHGYEDIQCAQNLAPEPNRHYSLAFNLVPNTPAPTEIDVQLFPAILQVTGIVRNSNGTPAHHTRVALTGLDPRDYDLSTFTRSDGRFRIFVPVNLLTPNNQCRLIAPDPANDTAPLATSAPFTLINHGTATQPAVSTDPITLILN